MSEFDEFDEIWELDGWKERSYVPIGRRGNILYCLPDPVDPSRLKELEKQGVELFEQFRGVEA